MKDGQFFKVLANNDTGQARGHQGGMVIPKAISEFFPPIKFKPSAAQPTADVRLSATLYCDGAFVETAATRFQMQTWGAKRSPEWRLTDNLGQLRNRASEDDILVFEKDLLEENAISLFLFTKASPQYADWLASTNGKRWGVFDKQNPPISADETVKAEFEIEEKLATAPSAFNDERPLVASITMKRARDRAFRLRLLGAYDFRCAFTGRKFLDPRRSNLVGIDAAHIVPVAYNGSDDPANGLPLSKDLHWAFDRGLIGVDADRRISVPKAVSELGGNEFLRDLAGQPIRESNSARMRAVDEAFAWHRENTLIK